MPRRTRPTCTHSRTCDACTVEILINARPAAAARWPSSAATAIIIVLRALWNARRRVYTTHTTPRARVDLTKFEIACAVFEILDRPGVSLSLSLFTYIFETDRTRTRHNERVRVREIGAWVVRLRVVCLRTTTLMRTYTDPIVLLNMYYAFLRRIYMYNER